MTETVRQATISTRELNRALLSRQLLLQRHDMPARQAIEHLVGQQAQEPNDPYFGLWSRLAGFQREELSRLITERQAVRSPLLRTTVHLVTAQDCLTMAPLLLPVLARVLRSTVFGKGTVGVDVNELLTVARRLMEEQPRTLTELGGLLQERWPNRDPKNLAYTVRYRAALVQIPPRGVWGATKQATWTTVESWLGQPLDADPSVEELVLRYLAAFGPATTSDIRTWSGLTGVREVVERLRPRLVMYRDERGRELFDAPDGPHPDLEAPAPPRFLPVYDNVLLSHADRARIVSERDRLRLAAGAGIGAGTFLLDGFVAGTWRLTRSKGAAALVIAPLRPIGQAARDELAEEGERLLVFAADAQSRDVRFVVSDP